MLRQRVLSAILLLPAVVLATHWGGWAFTTLVAVAALLAGYELCVLLRRGGYRPSRLIGLGLILALTLAATRPERGLSRPLLGAGLVLSLLWQLARPAPQRSLTDWALTVAGGVYIGWLAGFLVLVRGLPQGEGWAFLVLLAAWVNDSAGYLAGVYLAGRVLGRHAFSPTVSPKKTWEGSVTGWILCALVTAGVTRFLGVAWLPALGLGAVLGVMATLGDLAVSFIKRQVGVKDSSHLIPGHGGILDRIDSLLFVSPAVYTFAVWLAPFV